MRNPASDPAHLDDLWPKVLLVELSDFPLPIGSSPSLTRDAAEVIARTTQHEMYGVGQANAQAEVATAAFNPVPTPLDLLCHANGRSDTAAQLLAFYTVVRDYLPSELRTSLPTAPELKRTATESYLQGLRHERERHPRGLAPRIGVVPFDADPASYGSLPDAPQGLWRGEDRYRDVAPGLASVDFGISIDRVAVVLARSMVLEMTGAGQVAARAATTAEEPTIPHAALLFHSHVRARAAARQLATYAVIHDAVPRADATRVPSPERLKPLATLGYRVGLRDGLTEAQAPQARASEFNDPLFEELRHKPPGTGPRRSR